jgi:hypothetical protein
MRPAAPANATSYDYFSGFSYDYAGATLKIPACGFGHKIIGSGKRIDAERAWVMGVACDLPGVKFCNWRIDFRYKDVNGRVYAGSKGKLHTTCSATADIVREAGPRKLRTYGKACAELVVSNQRRANQCHNITQ